MNPKNLKKALGNIGKLIVGKIKADIKRKNVDATGGFSKSIKVEVADNIISVYSDKAIADYGSYVEGGSKPSSKHPFSTKKIEGIRKWIAAKGIRPRPRGKDGRFIKVKDYHYKGLPFAIARSVSEKGTVKRFGYKGSRVFETAFNEVRNEVGSKITDAFMEDIRNELNIIMEVNGSNT